MSSIISEFCQNTYRAAKSLFRSRVLDSSSASSWRSLLVGFLAFWILFNLVRINVADFWYSLNFKELWVNADYPPLCSDSSTKLLPWMVSDYPVLKSPDSNIRLLHIHPSSDIWGIEATLERASFLEQPRYRALSYAWGDATKVKPITVNGKRMDVTENLWKALFNIRDQHQTQTLWVDAICINQSNNEEKSIQVPLMSFIYSRAQEVIVWLGNHRGPRWVEHDSLSQWRGDWAISKATDHWPVTKHWLYVLVQEEYWKRCWIVQEITMGSRIRVYSGQSILPWRDFVELIKLYKSKVPLDGAAVDNILKLELLRQAKYTNGNAYSLNRLLEEFSDCFSSIALDKIFAFIGLASDCLHGCISIDYLKSPLKVYQELLSFWNSRCLQTGNEAIDTVHFAGLVRSVLSRTSVFVPKTLKPPGIGEDAESFLYVVCGDDRAQYCSLIPKLQSLLTWVDLISSLSFRLFSYLFKIKTQSRSLWRPSGPEASRMWAAQTNTEVDANRSPVRARGVIAGVVCFLGPMYRELIEHPNVLRRWTATLGTIWGLACNESSTRSAKVLNERLAMLLGPAADYRMRNFVSLDSNTPYSFYSSRLFVAFGPRREVVMGLAPWETAPGDVLVQFWNTDAVLVARKGGDSEVPVLVGRAGIVKHGEIMDWDIPKDKRLFDSRSDLIFDHLISISRLTRLSFDTVCLLGIHLQVYQETSEQMKDMWTSHDIGMKDIDVFRDRSSYENPWDASQIPRLDNISTENSKLSCFLRPCQSVNQG